MNYSYIFRYIIFNLEIFQTNLTEQLSFDKAIKKVLYLSKYSAIGLDEALKQQKLFVLSLVGR